MRQWLCMGGLVLLAGCASERVVLLPSADGKPSAVVVKGEKGEVVLDKPYAAAERRLGDVAATTSSKAEVESRYGQVLAAQPQRPVSFSLYFQEGGTQLTSESQALLPKIKEELARRKAPDVVVVGHTDRVGSLDANDALSLRRAQAVKGLLMEVGIADRLITATGRGEREPLVPTADEVAEARNRRVEILVR